MCLYLKGRRGLEQQLVHTTCRGRHVDVHQNGVDEGRRQLHFAGRCNGRGHHRETVREIRGTEVSTRLFVGHFSLFSCVEALTTGRFRHRYESAYSWAALTSPTNGVHGASTA